MANFIFTYHGGKAPDSPEAGAKTMQQWMGWFEDLGEAVLDGGSPVGMSKTVSQNGVTDDGGANPVSGYSLITAADMDAAVAMAKGCPMLPDGGSVEVSECLKM